MGRIVSAMGIFNLLKRQKKKPVRPAQEDNRLSEIKFVLPPIDKGPQISAEEFYADDKWVPKTKAELNQILQEIWTYAPDEFETMYCSIPVRPTMETDYELLRKGIEVVFRQKRFNESRPHLKNLLEDSCLTFASGNRKKGIEMISQIQVLIGKMK